MKLFIDTAKIEEIRDMAQYEIVSGVTTNPTLIARAGVKLEDAIKEISDLINGPISAEVAEADAETMIEQGKQLSKINSNVVIKLPMTLQGIKACKELTNLGIKTNVTLVFSPSQALLAMEANATYFSPFLGRMDDNGFDCKKMLEDIVAIKRNYSYQSQIIAASIRSLKHIEIAALAGADIATIPYAVFKKMVDHPLTAAGLVTFALDAKKSK